MIKNKKSIKQIFSSIPIILITIMIVLMIVMFSPACSKNGQETEEREPVAFTLPDLYGNEIDITDYRGNIVVLNFWATWCEPCTTEIPFFIEVYKSYKDKDVKFFGVADDDFNSLRKFSYDFEMNYPTLYDENRSVHSEFKINAIPQTFILDEEGYITFSQVGMMPEQQLIDAIESVM